MPFLISLIFSVYEPITQTRKWQDKDGNDRYTTEIIADEMQMLGARDGGGQQYAPSTSGRGAPADDFVDRDIPF